MALVGGHTNLTCDLKVAMDVMPVRRIAVFDTFDEGLDWIKAEGEMPKAT